jgi:hypothetical protein
VCDSKRGESRRREEKRREEKRREKRKKERRPKKIGQTTKYDKKIIREGLQLLQQ